MTEDEMRKLDAGDIVCHVQGAQSYVVTGNYGSYVVGVQTVDMTNPDEWVIVAKSVRFDSTHRRPTLLEIQRQRLSYENNNDPR